MNWHFFFTHCWSDVILLSLMSEWFWFDTLRIDGCLNYFLLLLLISAWLILHNFCHSVLEWFDAVLINQCWIQFLSTQCLNYFYTICSQPWNDLILLSLSVRIILYYFCRSVPECCYLIFVAQYLNAVTLFVSLNAGEILHCSHHSGLEWGWTEFVADVFALLINSQLPHWNPVIQQSLGA